MFQRICMISSQHHSWEIFYVHRTLHLLQVTRPFQHLWNSNIKEPFQESEYFFRWRNFFKHVNLFLDQGTFPPMQSFSLSKRELYYCHHKNKCASCLTTNQLKTQCLRKLKSFNKIHKVLGIKSKCVRRWPSEIKMLLIILWNYKNHLFNLSQKGLFYLISRIGHKRFDQKRRTELK